MQRHLPTQAQTLHKLLQVRAAAYATPAPALAFDLVVVDEASMIDLALMARLLASVPESASLILLGDKDQLASVEAGAVMGQLCEQAQAGAYDADTVAWVASADRAGHQRLGRPGLGPGAADRDVAITATALHR
jgi:exodeoxyribonuclease V alpha subunit